MEKNIRRSEPIAPKFNIIVIVGELTPSVVGGSGPSLFRPSSHGPHKSISYRIVTSYILKIKLRS